MNYKKQNLNENKKNYSLMVIEKVKNGKVVERYSKQLKEKRSKKGWCSMYKNDMKEVLMVLSKYPTAQRIWLFLWDYMKKDGTLKNFTQKEIAEKLCVQRQVVNRAFKKLREFEIIEKIDGEWRYNPFIFTISGMTEKQKSEVQSIWEQYISHHVWDRNKKNNVSKYQISDEKFNPLL